MFARDPPHYPALLRFLDLQARQKQALRDLGEPKSVADAYFQALKHVLGEHDPSGLTNPNDINVYHETPPQST